MRHDGEFTL